MFGCTNPGYMEFNPDATIDDGSCSCVGSVDLNVNINSEEPFQASVSVVGDYYSDGSLNLTGDDIISLYQFFNYNYMIEQCIYLGDPMFCDYVADDANNYLGGGFNLTGDDIISLYQFFNYNYMIQECIYLGDPMFCDYVADDANNYLGGGSNYEWSGQYGILSTSEEFIISTPGNILFLYLKMDVRH